MPGTGHSHRYKGSISNRNTKSAFQVLAPWNAKKNGEKNQVAVSTGGDNLNFKLMGAKMMSNYNDASNAWILDCSLVVLGNKIIDGSAVITGNVEIDGTLDVTGLATFKDVDICGNLRVWGKVTDLSDVDICGNLNANTGTFQGKLTNLDIHDGSGAGGIVTKYLTVTDNAYINTGDILHLVDVCDNILTLGNHNAATEEEVRGIVAKYIHANTDSSNVAFFGMDPSFNGGLVEDVHGQFVFIIDVSDNIGTIPASNIGGTLGRACFGTLDICGSYLYGGGDPGTGLPTQNVSDQANCQMHLVGKTIIACQTPAGGTCSSAQLDISGGIDVVGPSKLTDLSGALIDISGGQVTLLTDVSGTIAITNTQGNTDGQQSTPGVATGAIKISAPAGGIGVSWNNANDLWAEGGRAIVTANENAVDAIRLHSTGGTATTIQLLNDAGTGAGAIRLQSTAGGVTIDAGSLSSGVTIDAAAASSFTTSGGILTLDGAGGVTIDGNSSEVDITTTGTVDINAGNIDISGSTVDISGGTHVNLTDGSGANINIASGLIHLDVNSTILGQTLGQIKLTDGSGAYIDMSGGKIDISGDHVTITGGPTSISLKSQTINIGEAGGTVDIKGNVKVDDAVTFVVKDISATNIDVSGALTVNGGTIDMSGTNTAVGYQALQDNMDGSNNVAIGYQALSTNDASFNTAVGYQALTSNTNGGYNVGVGFRALYKNTTGCGNTAVGKNTIGGPLLGVDMTGSCNVAMGEAALYQITDGSYNVATGSLAMYSNQGSANVAVGYRALNQNVDGSKNTALGHEAGLGQSISGHLQISNTINIGYDTSCNASNTACIGNVDISCVYLGSINGNAKLDCSGIVSSGDAIINTLTVGLGGGNNATNTAIGHEALQTNITGTKNVAIGTGALQTNIGGSFNVATGYQALFLNTGSSNVATGREALQNNTIGNYNVATGSQTLNKNTSGNYNVATGYQALQDNSGGSGNTAIGYQALQDNSGVYNTAIGYIAGKGQTDISNTINIGYDTSCNASNTACIGNVDISCVYLGSTSGLAKLDCSGIVSSGLVETTDISCGSIYADGVPGTLGQVLSSTGTGIKWVDGTTVGSHWNVDSDGIHNTSGENVGIGKDSSNNVALDVSGNMAINGTINTLTVGFGSGDISNNTVVGYQALQSNTTGNKCVATGYQALYLNASGVGNTATGYQALQDNGGNGNYNTATGYQALQDNSGAGYGNVATGAFALYKNAGNHSYNTATGYQALQDNSGGYNTAIGYIAGKGQTDISNTINVGYDTSCNASKTACIGNADISCVYFGSINGNAKLDCSGIVSSGDAIINTLTVGLGGGNNATNTAIGDSALGKSSVLSNPYNTAIGYHALFNNTIGSNNVAIGSDALGDNIDGGYNVAIGSNALQANIDGQYNVATGYQALSTNDASFNTAVGYQALTSNTNGGYNVAMGSYALKLNTNGGYNVAMGGYALSSTTGSENVAIGYGAGGASAAPNDASLLMWRLVPMLFSRTLVITILLLVTMHFMIIVVVVTMWRLVIEHFILILMVVIIRRLVIEQDFRI